MNEQKSFTTALAIILPQTSNDQVNAIRSKNDKAYPRWMPHVNLLFPFVPVEQFDNAEAMLKKTLSKHGCANFEIKFETVSSFPHGNLHVSPTTVPENALENVFEAVAETFPWLVARPEFHPHMTLGQWPKQKLAEHVEAIQKEWKEISFNCAELVMIARNGEEPFRVVKRISLE